MKFLLATIFSITVSIATVATSGAQSPSDSSQPAERQLTKFESSLIGKWYESGNFEIVCYIASSGQSLFSIHPRGTLELYATPNNSLIGKWQGYQTTGQVVSGNFIVWSNGTWWSRVPTPR